MPIISNLISKLVWADGQPPQSPQQQQQSTPAAPVATTTTTTSTAQTPVSASTNASPSSSSDAARYPPAQQWEERPYPPIFSERSLKQLGLFFGGATFFALSVAVSRRAVARHLKASKMEIFAPNMIAGMARPGNINSKAPRDPMVAVEALNLATLNVISFATMAAGGTCWAFDLLSVEDLRRKARRTLYGGTEANLDEEAEREVAEWVAKTLGIDLEKAEEEAKGKMFGEEAVKKP
ncbi:hypothetical protein GE21DRAFT_242 [Neurospora crassa]|uniref:Altered inheritance of mitochondria protein 11 n=1 Tax=Neurospora crassa (strain ATCC 24698 / 74-OR23-1A / CBS 708.71 / DSM 1257 / FGSC 987) TaxID=367110 RepID=Q7SE06_NEUCR|nr:hypothetical protein NCU02177 [Neurospora crassa OR74A]EAA35011.1 hypothetical protein NCU02177 [Neurospora crassa OR74A]KHE81317.1 hypothetical protein GE21DRAFT_242 [Neurospora crassa]|eukprot:XP_964247.1 hypothetical protein NCU02177 [Neurospora crassa OR74A]